MSPSNERIKELRKEHRKSQQEIAELLGITQGAYSQIERGNTHLSLNQAVKISKLYKTNVDWIATGKGRKDKVDGKNGFISLVDLKSRPAYLKNGETALKYDMGHFRLPGFTDGTYRIFEIGDNKMRPTLLPHDYLVCTEVQKPYRIVEGTLCVVITDDEVHVGRATKNNSHLILAFDGNAFGEETFEQGQIKELWIAIAKITSAFFSLDPISETRMQKLEQKLESLEKMVNKD